MGILPQFHRFLRKSTLFMNEEEDEKERTRVRHIRAACTRRLLVDGVGGKRRGGGGLTLKPHGITRSNASMCARCENACISRILRFLVLLHLSCSRLSFFFTVEPLVDRDACSPSCFVSSQRSRINFRATRNCRGVEPCPWVSYSHPPSHTTTLTCCLSSSLKRKIIYRVDVNAVSV